VLALSRGAGERTVEGVQGLRWTLSLLAAIVLICAFGLVLAVTRHTFAVS
jgi:hypothetical protein